ncbi:MAG: hypothetical protein M1827_003258 [Pycnora praestabilis]|nr:MAG: hypothetical protein M1827_003258 [Pycnora praestabilis]
MPSPAKLASHLIPPRLEFTGISGFKPDFRTGPNQATGKIHVRVVQAPSLPCMVGGDPLSVSGAHLTVLKILATQQQQDSSSGGSNGLQRLRTTGYGDDCCPIAHISRRLKREEPRDEGDPHAGQPTRRGSRLFLRDYIGLAMKR